MHQYISKTLRILINNLLTNILLNVVPTFCILDMEDVRIGVRKNLGLIQMQD